MGRSILAWGRLHERTEHLSGADFLAISPNVFGRPTKRGDLLNRAIMLTFRLQRLPRCRQHKSPSEGEQVVAKICSASRGGMRTPTREAPSPNTNTAFRRSAWWRPHRTDDRTNLHTAPTRTPYLHLRRMPPLASEVHGDALSRTLPPPYRWEAIGRRCARALNVNGWDKFLFL